MTTVLAVSGMSCGHCVRSITQAIHTLAPEAMVQVDLVSGQVEVQSQLTVRELIGVIEEAGFEAKSL